MKRIHAQIQALKGRNPKRHLMSPLQGLEWFVSPITGRCPVLMILPLQGIDYEIFENHYSLFISRSIAAT